MTPSIQAWKKNCNAKYVTPCWRAIGTCTPAALTGIPAVDLRLTPASQHGSDDIPYPGVITGSSTALRCNRTGAQSPDMQAFGRWALTRAPLQRRAREWTNHVAEIARN